MNKSKMMPACKKCSCNYNFCPPDYEEKISQTSPLLRKSVYSLKVRRSAPPVLLSFPVLIDLSNSFLRHTYLVPASYTYQFLQLHGSPHTAEGTLPAANSWCTLLPQSDQCFCADQCHKAWYLLVSLKKDKLPNCSLPAELGSAMSVYKKVYGQDE